ncbi:MAG: methyltransferase domain-containing protein, partial [Actinomycetota bacterium]|nr:methyltransferase domain-containing protein [Actinomycetota bacterium]
MPSADGSFDGAYMVHVAMNIADKQRLFAEARRVLPPGRRFGILHLMRTPRTRFPTQCRGRADTPATIFAETPASYRSWLAAAGFLVEREEGLSELVLRLRRKAQVAAAPAQ